MERCKEKVFKNWSRYLCSRNAVIDGFCKQHHPEAKAKRQHQANLRFKKKMDNSPIIQLQRRIEELEEKNTVLLEKLQVMSGCQI